MISWIDLTVYNGNKGSDKSMEVLPTDWTTDRPTYNFRAYISSQSLKVLLTKYVIQFSYYLYFG